MCYGGCDCARCAGEPIKPMEHKKQWVQYISGQGEKWLVDDENERLWVINLPHFMRLPKSEYRLCDPPEVWRDVSEGARVGSDLSCILYDNLGREISVHNGYRLRKVRVYPYQQPTEITTWAFIVEQKVS